MELGEDVVLLDSKYLKIADNAATSKKVWWNNTKKQFVVTKSDFELKNSTVTSKDSTYLPRTRKMSSASASSVSSVSSRRSKRTKSDTCSEISNDSNTYTCCCVNKIGTIEQSLSKMVEYVSLTSRGISNEILAKLQTFFLCNICLQIVKGILLYYIIIKSYLLINFVNQINIQRQIIAAKHLIAKIAWINGSLNQR